MGVREFFNICGNLSKPRRKHSPSRTWLVVDNLEIFIPKQVITCYPSYRVEAHLALRDFGNCSVFMQFTRERMLKG